MMTNQIRRETSESLASRLAFDRLSVEFGATKALHEISVDVRPGEIVGLLGHNGAGKSTLFNVAAGVVTATRGSFRIDGATVDGRTDPSTIADLGITILYQEPAVAVNLSVIENLYLGRRAPYSRAERERVARDALERVGADLDLNRPVGSLELGDRQLVSLARGVIGGEMKVLLLDEPTAALGQAETDALHALIRTFATSGVAVMYVSHRLPDILEVCSRIMVLRAGRLVRDGDAAEFTPKTLSQALVPELEDAPLRRPATPGDVTLDLSGPYPITARAGEVVGLFGMAGGEQFRLIESMYGLGEERVRGSFDGRPLTIGSPTDAIRQGIFLVPADRDRDGLIGGLSASENIFLPWYSSGRSRGAWVTSGFGRDVYERARDELNILGPGPGAAMDQFSGGNRQKQLLARWLFPKEPRVLLLAQPTQGVDVGAKRDIVRVVREAAAAGATVLVASAESDEITSLCDRAYVLRAPLVRELPQSPDLDEQLLATLLDLAATKNPSQKDTTS